MLHEPRLLAGLQSTPDPTLASSGTASAHLGCYSLNTEVRRCCSLTPKFGRNPDRETLTKD